MAEQRSAEFRLEVGDVVIGLVCESPAYAESLNAYFGRPPVEREADVRLELELDPRTDTPHIPTSLYTTKRADADGFDIADGLITGRLDPATGEGRLRVHNILTRGSLPRVFEQILYQVFYTAMDRRGLDALLIHSAGVIVDGAGYLFVGASGMGKSTIAELSRGHSVLNDEINHIAFGSDGAEITGCPFNGFFEGKSTGRAPLRGIFTLSHGPRHALHALGPAEAAATVATQIVPPVGIEQPLPPDIRLTMVDLAARLCAAAPVRRLEFLQDAGFWEVIAEADAGGST